MVEDSRFKKIMEDLGMPNSISLYCALKQIANETAQQIHKEYAELLKNKKD